MLILNRHAIQKPPVGPVEPLIGHPLIKGLVFATVFNENGSAVVNDAVSGRISGGIPGTWSSSRYGPGMLLNGSTQYVSFGDRIEWHPGGSDYTVVVFANPPSSASTIGLFSKRNNTSFVQLSLMANVSNAGGGASPGQLGLYNSDGSAVLSGDTNSTAVIDGAYHQFAVTRSTSSMLLYSDAVNLSINQAGVGNPIYTGPEPIILGASGGSSGAVGGYLSGSIIYAYYWLRALSQAELRSLYAEPYQMFASRPIQRWIRIGGVGGGATLTAGLMTSTALSPTSTMVGGAVISGGLETATVSSPASTMVGAAVLSAGIESASASSSSSVIVGGAVITGNVTSSTVSSPTAAVVGGIVVSAGLETATAQSPSSAMVGGAAISGGIETANAQSFTATMQAGTALVSQLMQATAISPISSLVGGALLAAQLGTVTTSLYDAIMHISTGMTAQLATGSASEPSASLLAGAVLTSNILSVSALVGSGALTGGLQVQAGIMGANAGSYLSSIIGGATLSAGTISVTAIFPIGSFSAGIVWAAGLLVGDAYMLVAFMQQSSPVTSDGPIILFTEQLTPSMHLDSVRPIITGSREV